MACACYITSLSAVTLQKYADQWSHNQELSCPIHNFSQEMFGILGGLGISDVIAPQVAKPVSTRKETRVLLLVTLAD